MDVFEHLVDPVETVERLWVALKPGGFLYARISAESDEDRPQHIVQDFGPTFDTYAGAGLGAGLARRVAVGPSGLPKIVRAEIGM